MTTTKQCGSSYELKYNDSVESQKRNPTGNKILYGNEDLEEEEWSDFPRKESKDWTTLTEVAKRTQDGTKKEKPPQSSAKWPTVASFN